MSDSLRRLDPIEFRKQYEGTFPAPEPLADEALAKIAHKYRDHAIIRTLVDDAVAQRHLNTTLTARLVERDAEIAALQAERHELCQFLIEWDGQDSFREPDYRDQLEERYLNWISRSKDVLSDAIEAAVPAPPTAAPHAAAEQKEQ